MARSIIACLRFIWITNTILAAFLLAQPSVNLPTIAAAERESKDGAKQSDTPPPQGGNPSATTKQPPKPPVIELRGDNFLIIKKGTPYVDPGAKAKDVEGKDITSEIVVKGLSDIDTNKVGRTYTLVYSVVDPTNGTRAETQRQVIIQNNDNAMPASSVHLILKMNSLGVGVGASWGEGTLIWDSEEIPFSMSSFDLAQVGITTLQARGTVHNLRNPFDLVGQYVGVGGSITVGAGGSLSWLVNQNGVSIKLWGVSKGIGATVGVKGVTIKKMR